MSENSVIISMGFESVTKSELLSFLENEAKFRIDSYIEGAIEQAEELHLGLKREDDTSSFLETHIWPVTMNVVRHYMLVNKPITAVQVVSAILHDVLEDDDRILDIYTAKGYGFEAYLRHRFGDKVYNVASTLKVKPLQNYSGTDDKEREFKRFCEYCNDLANSEYDIKTIKLADRLNNMRFILNVPGHPKVNRYIKEAEDFYIAYTILNPRMDNFYTKIKEAYNDLKQIRNVAPLIT